MSGISVTPSSVCSPEGPVGVSGWAKDGGAEAPGM